MIFLPNFKLFQNKGRVLTESVSIKEDIESMKKYYPNIPEEDFMRYIKLDPTYNGGNNAGTYAKWILGLVQRGKLTNEGHIKDLLTRFEEEKNNLINKDIMRYKTVEEVDDMLNNPDSYKEKTHRQEVRQRQKDKRNADLETDAELVYEDSDWEVWIPKTYSASCKLGQGSTWCTASTESDYYYNYYKNHYGGKYYININKHDREEKYQFHFPTTQFKDISDMQINLKDFLDENNGLKDFYIPIMKNIIGIGVNGIEQVEISPYDFYNAIQTNLSQDFIEGALRGELLEQFTGVGGYITYKDAIEYYDDLTDELKEELIEFGVSSKYDLKDLLDNLDNEDNEDDEDDEEVHYDILNAFVRAVSEAYEVGSANACEQDLFDSIDVEMTPDVSFEDIKDGYARFLVDREVYSESIDTMVSYFDYVYDTGEAPDYFEFVVLNLLSNVRFYEPRYGWHGFDYVVLNDVLGYDLYYIRKNS